jgi:TP901 family phage tail tape measure protein
MAIWWSDLNIVVKLVDQASKELKSLSKEFENAWDKINTQTQAAQSFTKALAWTALVVGGLAVKEFMTFEKTMSWVKAVLSPTADEFTALWDKAKQLWKDTTFTQGEVAKSMEELAKNWMTATQILNGAADATVYLAAAAGTDLTTAATISSDAMSIFWLKAEEMKTAINGITWVAVASKFWVDDYALALAQGWWVAKAVWVSFEDFNTSIAWISNLFASGSDAWTSFKTFLQRLVPSSDAAAEAMQRLGLEFFDSNGKMKSMWAIAQELQDGLKGLSDEQKNQALTTIFWTDAMRAAVGLAQQGEEGFKKLNDQISKTDAMEQAKIRLDNLSGAWEKFTGSLSVVMVDLGGKIGAVLEPVLLKLSDFIDNFSSIWAGLSPEMQTFITVVWGVGVALAWLVVVAWTLGMILPVILTGLSAITGALAFLTWPVGLVIAAFAAFTAAYTTNFWGFADFINWVVAKITPLFNQIVEGVIFLYNQVAAWVDRIKEPFMGVVNFLLPFIQEFLWNFGTFFSSAFDWIITMLQGAWQIIQGVFTLAFWIIGGAFDIFLNLLSWNWSGAWEGIKALLVSVFDWIVLIIQGSLNIMGWAIQIWLAAIKLYFSNIWTSIKLVVSWFWDWITTFTANTLKEFWVNIDKGLAAINTAWSNTWTWIKGVVEGVWTSIKSTIASGINWVVDKINGLISKVNAVSTSIWVPAIPLIDRVAFQNWGIVPWNFQNGWILAGSKTPANHDQIPAMLDPGELILNRAQQVNLAGQLSWNNTNQKIIQVNINWNSFYWDDESFVDKIWNAIVEKFQTHYSLNSF